MPRYRIKAGAAAVSILLSLVLAACSSIPGPRSAESTLLVVQSKRELSGVHDIALRFWLYMQDGSRYQISFSHPENLTFIRDLGPGTATSKMLQATLKSDIRSESGDRHFDYPLRVETKMKAGSYTVFPATIVYREEKTREGHYQFRIEFEPIDPAAMSNLITRLEGMGISDHWSRAD